jgi:hypothetical protein
VNAPESHLSPETLEAYFASGSPVVHQLAADPRRTLRVDPPEQTLELWTPAVGPEPDVTALSRVRIATEEMDDGPWFVLTVDARHAHFEAYSLLAAVDDDLAAGRPFHLAVSRSIATYRELLSGRGRISDERTVGLLGELLLLEHLVVDVGEDTALTAWLGPAAEEHDFVLAEVDAEVKTTLSERRRHVIGTEHQLQESPARDLWLVSIQLTRAGGAPDGFGLGDLVGRIRRRLETGREDFAAHLSRQGWRDDDADLYRDRYLYRTKPAAYRVDAGFPALTRVRIDAVVPQAELVGAVSYRVDVTGLPSGTPPGVLAGFVGGTNP